MVFVLSLFRAGGWAVGPGDLGVGVVLGDPTGPTLKYWTERNQAIDLGLGFQDDFIVYADYLWHGWNVFPQPERGIFGGYVGFGPRFEDRDHKDNKFGIRTVAGIDYWFEPYPFEAFFEVVPVFQLSPDTDTELDAGIGIRYYFTMSPSK